jgi:hypothetical protein
MDKNIWDERRRGLEDEFFAKQNHAVLAKLRQAQARDAEISDLSQATGIKNADVLAHLVDHGVTSAAALSLSLVPLVRVAWADGSMDYKEYDAILQAAAEQGIAPETPAHDLLVAWLKTEPPASLVESWNVYVKGLRDILTREDFSHLQESIMGRARVVAATAGGFLGLGAKVSDAEEREIRSLERAFSA